MFTPFEAFVEEQTRPDDIQRRLENELLIRQARRRAKRNNPLGSLLLRSGKVLMSLGSRMQDQREDNKPIACSHPNTAGAD